MKKFCCLILCGILFVSNFSMFCSAADPIDPYELNETPHVQGTYYENELQSLDEYALIMDNFSNNPVPYSENDNTYSGLTASQYPDEYSGAYIGSTGELVVMIQEDNEDYIESLREISGADDLLYVTAKYSYAELLDILTAANEYFGNDDCGFMLKKTSVSNYENCVNIYLDEVNDETIYNFKKYVSDSDAIHFIEMNEEIAEEVNYMAAGSAISSTSSGFTLGFRCKRTNSSGAYEYGFVTVSHGAGSGDTVYYAGNKIGTVTLSYNIYDCSFVKITNSSYQASNSIASTGKILYTSQLANIAEGVTVYKYGKSTQETSGTVVELGVSYTSSSGYLRQDCFTSTYSSQAGDSGGPVYRYGTSTYQSLGGIHVANDGTLAYAQLASNIINLMDLERY